MSLKVLTPQRHGTKALAPPAAAKEAPEPMAQRRRPCKNKGSSMGFLKSRCQEVGSPTLPKAGKREEGHMSSSSVFRLFGS